MLPEIGHYALIIALMLAALQSTVPLIGAYRRDPVLMASAPHLAVGQLFAIAFAYALLTNAFVSSDFSLMVTAANSHTDKPLMYKISGVWSNHEGSMLLWVLILAVYGGAVALFGNNLPWTLKARVLSVHGMIGFAFLLFILFTSNPFARLFPAPANGDGINPILQDPGLAIHPPMLYLGYVGFSMAFSFSVAALMEGRVDAAWARWVRPWVLAAWVCLTAGIALGSFWAYYTLGWGGWWFWDPVENASFMPWLSGTALLHSAIVVERRNALQSWTILLGILTFTLSLIGTFLVRSGVLTSVHSFANDPARGVFILGILVLATGGALMLYALRAGSLRQGSPFAIVSREGGLVLNNVFLAVAAGVVFFGTFWPLVVDYIGGDKISVGAPFFNRTFVPVMAPLLLAMVLGPMLRWKRDDLGALLARAKSPACLGGDRDTCHPGADDGAQPRSAARVWRRRLADHRHAVAAGSPPQAGTRAVRHDLAARRRHATILLRIDPRPWRHRRAGRGHHRHDGLSDREHSADEPRRKRGTVRLHLCLARRDARPGAELLLRAGNLRRRPARPHARRHGAGAPLLSGAPADHHASRHHGQSVPQSLSQRRRGERRQEMGGTDVLSSAGVLDLGRRAADVAGRPAVAERPAPAHRHADAGRPPGCRGGGVGRMRIDRLEHGAALPSPIGRRWHEVPDEGYRAPSLGAYVPQGGPRYPSSAMRAPFPYGRRKWSPATWTSIVLALLILLLSTPAFAVNPEEILADPALESRARTLSQELRCLVCQNQSIDDSDAGLAKDLRVLLRERLTAGDTDEQAMAFIVNRYGNFVLLKPPFQWNTALLWLSPVLLLLLAGGGFYAYLRRGKDTPEPAALNAEDEARLAQLLEDGPNR